jgi:hypothetical protein
MKETGLVSDKGEACMNAFIANCKYAIREFGLLERGSAEQYSPWLEMIYKWNDTDFQCYFQNKIDPTKSLLYTPNSVQNLMAYGTGNNSANPALPQTRLDKEYFLKTPLSDLQSLVKKLTI